MGVYNELYNAYLGVIVSATVLIRVTEESRQRLKILAAQRGMSLLRLVEVLSQTDSPTPTKSAPPVKPAAPQKVADWDPLGKEAQERAFRDDRCEAPGCHHWCATIGKLSPLTGEGHTRLPDNIDEESCFDPQKCHVWCEEKWKYFKGKCSLCPKRLAFPESSE